MNTFFLKQVHKFNGSELLYMKSSFNSLSGIVNLNSDLRFFRIVGIQQQDRLGTGVISSFNLAITNTQFAIFKNSLSGKESGFFVELTLKGIGFRVFKFESYLFLQLGFSHFYVYKIPAELIIKAKRDRIVIFGHDKALVGLVARELYSLRLPDAYKAKGIQYKSRIYKLKEGKKK